MNSLAIKAVVAITLLALGFASGWMVKGWKVGSDESKAIAAQVAEFNQKVEAKNENIKLVDVAAADLGRVKLRLQACKADLSASAQDLTRARIIFEQREADLGIVEQRIKSDALTCDLFVEDLRAK